MPLGMPPTRLRSIRIPAGRMPKRPPIRVQTACYRLGIKHWRQKEYERAIQFLETALSKVIRPKDNFLEALCYNAIALVETDLGKIVEAIQAYQSAASLAPEHIFPWNSLGNLNCMLDRYDDALAAFREGIEHNPKDPVSWNGLGDVYHKLGRFEDAITAYQLGNVFEKQALDEDPLKEYEKIGRWPAGKIRKSGMRPGIFISIPVHTRMPSQPIAKPSNSIRPMRPSRPTWPRHNRRWNKTPTRTTQPGRKSAWGIGSIRNPPSQKQSSRET